MNSHFLLLAGFLSSAMVEPLDYPVVLEINQGRLVRVLPWRGYPSDLPTPDLRYADFYGLTPLADAHVHLALDGVDFQAARGRWQNEEATSAMFKNNLDTMLAAGVLGARDGGDRPGLAHRLATHAPKPFCLSTTHPALSRAGGYGAAFALPLPAASPLPWDELLQEIKQAGGRYVKIMLSGIISFTKYGQVGPIQFSLVELQDLCRQAADLNLPVMVHASGSEAAALATSCPIHSLEHGYFLTDSTLEKLAGQEIYWVPTLAPVAAQAPYFPVAGRSLERQLQMIAQARQLGVAIAAGSDAGATGVRHGSGLLRELELLQQCGYTPLELLTEVLRRSWLCLDPDLDPGWPSPALNLYRRPPWHSLSALTEELETILCWSDENVPYQLEESAT